MGWFDKIKKQTTIEDNSPELKKGEIKSILLNQADKFANDFPFTSYKNSRYTFQRQRAHKNHTVYETLQIVFGLKDRNFSCSVASRLNPTYINSGNYNGGLINPHVDLIVLKKGTGVIPVEEAYYFHNGRVARTTKITEQIFNDFVSFGQPFIDKQYKRLRDNELINTGLEIIGTLKYDTKLLKNEIEYELKNGGHLISSIKHPVYIELKETLQSIPNQTREERKEISRLAFDLIELYYTDRQNGT